MFPTRLLFVALLFVISASRAQAETVLYTAAGGNLAASAQFEIVSYDFGTGMGTESGVLKITLSNTADSTTEPADLLTGLFLTVNPDLTWSNTASAFDGTAPVVTTSTGTVYDVDVAPAVNHTPTDGGWALTNGESSGYFATYAGIDLTAYNVGLTTVGCDYPAVKGKDLGPPADNYGLYSATTASLTTSLNQQLPLIKGSVIFYMKPASGLNSLSQITGVAFVYGSTPSAKIVGSHVPLPSSLVLALTGMPSLFLLRRWRGRQCQEERRSPAV